MRAYNPESFAPLYHTPTGQRLWEFLNRPTSVATMKTATLLGKTAVEGIEEALLEEFEDDADEILSDRWKQMIGHMIRQVMIPEGYEIDQQNVKIASSAFTRATRYKRAGAFTFYAHRAGDGSKEIALTGDRAGGRLPADRKWHFWKSFEGGIRGRIAFGLEDEKAAQEQIATTGYYTYKIPRLLKGA